ncbi:MAG: baseplate J/gp47 family protein, partial [Ktedonobacteraceae bacterium]|nr:baseplate J/gp47 family protein [Ktedonobacteraceae bacterium]
MRQGNGTELLGMNDPRSATIGVIYVSPNDDRKSVLAAILTQEKLGRKDIVIDLPVSNNAFQSSQDFKDLEKDVARKLQAKIIFIVTGDVADYARQRDFLVFPTLDSYTQSLNVIDDGDEKKEAGAQERRWPFIGRKSKPLNRGAAAAGGVIAGAAGGAVAASALSRAEPGTPKGPEQQGNIPSSSIEPDDQNNAPVPPRRGAVARSTPAASASTIDDDDAIDDTPSVPVRHGLGTTGAVGAGAAGGFLAGETLRRGQANPDLDAAGPTPLRSTPASPDTPVVTAVSPLSQGSPPPATPITNAPEPLEEEADPGIIDLRPVPRAGSRSTVDLKGTAGAGAVPAARPVEPPTRGATRRRNGGGAAAAGLAAGGLALGAGAAAGSTSAGAPTAASGGANAGGAVVSSPRPAGVPPQRGTPPGRGRRGNPPPRRGRVLLALLLLLLLLLASTFVCVAVNPGILPSSIIRPISGVLPGLQPVNATTITITPASKEVQDSYVMQAVTNQPNADQLQVSMRNLNVTPDAQSKTVTGTGPGKIPAVAARGRLTFLNGSFTVPYTVASGTVVGAANGVSVVTEQAATIQPAVPGGANGSVSVPAHAVTPGTAGNLDQGSINKSCCTAAGFVFVKNDSAFTGGVDSKSYTFVQQGDVNAVAVPLENTASQQASTQFKQQLKPNEKLVVGPNCKPTMQIPAGTVGDQGHTVASTTVTVTASCTGAAYDRGAAQAIAKDRLQKKASIDPGQGYT